MTEADFDNVFADLLDGDEELKAFAQVLRDQLPQAFIQLHGDNGVVLPPPEAAGCPLSVVVHLLDRAREAGATIAEKGKDGEWCYGIRIDKINAGLLLSLPGRSENLLEEPHGRQLLQGVVDYALHQQEQQLLVIENEQIFRQIGVLNQKHTDLIEDNFRQYRLIQEKEKEYARTLESEIARQTAELRKTNARLEEASRLQSEFLANMSHELRTPMNAIIGFSDLLVEADLDEEAAEYANTIKNAGMNLLVLINDILDLAKIEAGRVELEDVPFDLRVM
ncbi:MAG: hybrid sensor histidine kinase/response regulator, partial [Desulfobulbaceae bacterium]|nr:hybrid sensor histidine kinase/response regulator [Desulfobulbaceae bacterium]